MRKDSTTGALIYSADFTNTYYHLYPNHVRRKNPIFTGIVYIFSILDGSLSGAQKAVLGNTDLNILFKD
jgi:hypothetical protein